MKHVLLSVSLFFISLISFSQWNKDTLVRNPVCTAAGEQYEQQMCSDGHGGVIMTWADLRTSPEAIYAQRIDTNGVTKWTSNGIVITPGSADAPLIVSDGAGGAVIIYNLEAEGGAESVYGQRIDSNGNFVWNPFGVAIATSLDSRIRGNTSNNQNAVSDGAGGAYVTWQTYSPFQIVVQHIDGSSNLLWGANGLTVTNADSTTAGYESYILNTDSGTAVVAYSYNENLYLQRINANGTFQWGPAGVLVNNSFYQEAQACYLLYDSISAVKNVKIVWADERSLSSRGLDLYAQKLDLNGNTLWTANGSTVAASSGDDYEPVLVPDNLGGFFMIYGSVGETVVVQHVNNNGIITWGLNGIQPTPGQGQQAPNLCSDGSGGIITETLDANNSWLIAQRYNSSGTAMWRAGGIPIIANGFATQGSPLVSLNDGTAVTCWQDDRNSGASSLDIYAAKFGGSDGFLPVKLLSFTGELLKGQTLLQWTTTQEISSSYFGVERSADGHNFTQLTTVPAHGTSNVVNNYSAIDPTPLSGDNFYRLKEVDNDGNFNYSPIVHLIIGETNGYSIYPNPVKDNLSISLTVAQAQETSLQLYDIRGKLLATKQVQLTKGYNLVEWNVNNLSSGIYIVNSPSLGMQLKMVKE